MDMNVRGDTGFVVFDNVFHLGAKVHHVVARSHLYRKHDASVILHRGIAVFDVWLRLLVPRFNSSHIAQPQGLSGFGIGKDNQLTQVIYVPKGDSDVHQCATFVVAHLARDGPEAVGRQFGRHH